MEEAMLEVLATVLATPEFLYLTQQDSKTISEVELASRLSFFLWSSIPDEELLTLAWKGALNKPEVLKAQIGRMLADPRAKRFSQNFVQQWLGLDAMASVVHVKDGSLFEAMQEEPVAFFDHVLKSNDSVMDFLHSDYAVVNEKLAGALSYPRCLWSAFSKGRGEARSQSRRDSHQCRDPRDEFRWQGFPSAQARHLDAGTRSP
jgi:hypothetical protein